MNGYRFVVLREEAREDRVSTRREWSSQGPRVSERSCDLSDNKLEWLATRFHLLNNDSLAGDKNRNAAKEVHKAE